MLSPDSDPIPSDTSDPIPAASSPGTSRSRSLAPPIAVASIRITAAISGEAKMNDIAAKLPEAVTSVSACGGVSRRARLIISARDARAQHDQRGLRAEHQPEPDRRQTGQDYSRHDVHGPTGRPADRPRPGCARRCPEGA